MYGWIYVFQASNMNDAESIEVLFDYANGEAFNVRAKNPIDDYIVTWAGADTIAEEISNEFSI